MAREHTSPAKGRPVKGARRNRGPRVLLVEDDALLALDLEQALRDAGAGEVTICPTMAATLAALEGHVPHALVIDVHLADRDDGWALAELASMLGSPGPRIAFSTGSPEAIPDAVRAMGEVYAKPYDPALLAQALLGNLSQKGLLASLRDRLR